MDDPQSPRPALAYMSPNVKAIASTTPAFMKKAVVGSPLKRGFTAALEEGGGLLYLKRRRLAENEVLSEMGGTMYRLRDEALLDPPLEDGTKDKLPSMELLPTPTEPNTPSEEDCTTHGFPAERQSFSSLINYDPSSQTSNTAAPGLSSAEMLRLRLRIAMYKVRTHQIESSFEDLKDERQCRELARRKAIDDAVAELRREAQEVLDRTPNRPYLDSDLPPTSPVAAHDSGVLLQSQSRFTALESPDKLPWSIEGGTPLRGVWGTSTPPNTGPRLSRVLEPELTSSVVRGRVAEGLLGLRNAL